MEWPAPKSPPATACMARSAIGQARVEPVAIAACSFLLSRKPPAPAGCRPAALGRFVLKPGHIPAACRWQRRPFHRRTARARFAVAAKATRRPDDKTAAFRQFVEAD